MMGFPDPVLRPWELSDPTTGQHVGKGSALVTRHHFVSGMEMVARELNPTRQLKSDRHFTPPPGAPAKGFFGEEENKRFDRVLLRTCSSASVPRREQVVFCDFALKPFVCANVGPFFPFSLLASCSTSFFFSPLFLHYFCFISVFFPPVS